MITSSQPQHEQILAEPRYYDIGFSNRDFAVESGFLDYLSRNLGRGPLESFLEVCCGPGYYMNTLAAQGVRAYGIDASRPMVAYVEERAEFFPRPAPPSGHHHGAGENGVAPPSLTPTILRADPRDFTLPEAVDLAFCPNGSIQYLLHGEDVITHLVAVARCLGRGGLYVLDIEHPATLFGPSAQEEREWESERDGVTVGVRKIPGPLDPITQVRDLEIRLTIREQGETRVVRDSAPVRGFTYPELRSLVKLSGIFQWVTTFGDLSITQPFDATEGSRSMVPVLRCCT